MARNLNEWEGVSMAKPTDDVHLAVLIDADNASAQHLERLLVEIAKYGTATVGRAYSDCTATKSKAKSTLVSDKRLTKLLSEAVEATADDDGWAYLGGVGSNLTRLASDFDTRTWGYSKLTDLLKAHPGYDVVSCSPGDGKPKVAVVRRKPRK
jgi:hypothetical protein